MSKFWKDLSMRNFIVFFEKIVIFSLQFGFQQKYSTTHVLIHSTGKIRYKGDKSNYASRIFLNSLKAFDTLNHLMLLKRLEYYGVGRI